MSTKRKFNTKYYFNFSEFPSICYSSFIHVCEICLLSEGEEQEENAIFGEYGG